METPKRWMTCLLAALAGVATAPTTSAQFTDWVGREFTIAVGGESTQSDVIAREFTVFADDSDPDPKDFMAREFTVGVATPDLLPFDVVIPTEGNAGQEFLVSWRTRNDGTVPAEVAFTDRLQFAGALATGVDFANPAGLAPGQYFEHLAGPFLFPDVLVQTDFTATITADSTAQVDEEPQETAELNNVYGPITITVYPIPRPDLAVLITQDPPPTNGGGGWDAGDTLQIGFQVANVGDAPTNVFEWTDRIYLVPDPGQEPTGVSGALASWSVQSLSFLSNGTGSEPGTTYDQLVELVLPTGIVGDFYLGVVTDADDAMLEPDEVNNLDFAAPITITLPPHPDLAPMDVSLLGYVPGQTPIQSGQSWDVVWDVHNVMQAFPTAASPQAAFVDRVCISTNLDDTTVAGDILLGAANATVPSIPVGASEPRQAPVFLPVDLNFQLPSAGDTYYFKVRADATNVVAELDPGGVEQDGNNIAVSAAVVIPLAGTPDLVATSVELAAGQGTPLVAHPLQVTWTVSNAGSPGWNVPLTWHDRIWLSKDTPDLAMSGETYLLGTFSESAVQSMGEWIVPDYTKTRTVTVPSAASQGSYFLVLRTDTGTSHAYGDVFEYDANFDAEANNEDASAAAFQVDRIAADLELAAQATVGSDTILPPTLGAPGQTITLPWTVTNLGPGATNVGSWADRVYLSTDPVALVGATLLVSRSHSPGLGVGESYQELRSASVPFVAPGTGYYLVYRADYFGGVFEDGMTANNTNPVSLPFEVSDVIADLVVDAVSATGRMSPGDPVVVGWTVSNQGSAATGGSYWVDRVQLWDGASTYVTLGTRPRTSGLGAGATYDAIKNFAVPITLDPGTWFVVVDTDYQNHVFELDDGNNSGMTRTEIQVDPPLPANLVARNVLALNEPISAGQNLQVSWEVANDGQGPTSSTGWTDAFYLSLDHFVDPLDVFLGYYSHGTVIGAGEFEALDSQTLGLDLTVPLWASGSYVLLVVTNSNGAVYEAGLTNDNLAFAPELVDVTSPALTDLQIEEVNYPPSALLGEEIQITWRTRNQSATDVPASWTWSDDFWILPDGETFPTVNARLLGQYLNVAGGIGAGMLGIQQDTSLIGAPAVIPGLLPGDYRIVARSDVLNQIAEIQEGIGSEGDDNVFAPLGTITLQAIDVAAGSSAPADLANGASRWFRLTTDALAAESTLHLELTHSDINAHCELYVREGAIPSLGVFDLASPGLEASDPSVQEITIPRAEVGDVYYVLARTVDGAGSQSIGATLATTVQPFLLDTVEPATVGAGDVTLVLGGNELWKASRVLIRTPGGGTSVDSVENYLTGDGELLARFELGGLAHGAYEVVLVDESQTVPVLAIWSETLNVVAPSDRALGLALEVSPNVRKGEEGRATLRFTNEGNVNLPFAAATLGHLRAPGALDPIERVVIGSAQLGVAEIETNLDRDSFVVFMEDLGPAQSYEIDLELAVGAMWLADLATLTVSGTPWGTGHFLGANGFVKSLSESQRQAVADDPATHSLLAAIAQDPPAWRAYVNAALANGNLFVDRTTMFVPGDEARTVRDLLDEIAQAVFIEAGLPSGAEVPQSAIDGVASTAWCAPFAGPVFDCDSLFPPMCDNDPERTELTIVEAANVPAGSVCLATLAPDDPNTKIKPHGVGTQSLVNGNEPLTYRIEFENVATAGAWASRVEILDELEVEYRGSSLRLRELRIGETLLSFPPNTVSYQDQVLIQVNEDTESLVQISIGLDAVTDTIFCTMQALDPLTGLPPISGEEGFLPPNELAIAGQGSGHFEFSIMADLLNLGCPGPTTSPSGTTMRNRTTIQFNQNEPLVTNEVSNELDVSAPTSSLTLGAVVGGMIPLSWSADDVETVCGTPFEGSGVDTFTVSVAPDPQGPWTPFLTDTSATSASFQGTFGATHFFKVEATDRVGNVEHKQTADGDVTVDFAAISSQEKR